MESILGLSESGLPSISMCYHLSCFSPWHGLILCGRKRKGKRKEGKQNLRCHLLEGTTFKKAWKTWSSSSWQMSKCSSHFPNPRIDKVPKQVFETTLKQLWKPQKAAPGEYRGGLLCVGAEPPWLCHWLSVCIHISLSHSLHEFCWVSEYIVTLEKNQSIFTGPSTHHAGLVLHGTRLKRWGSSKRHRCGREFGRARTFRRGRLLGLVSFRK